MLVLVGVRVNVRVNRGVTPSVAVRVMVGFSVAVKVLYGVKASACGVSVSKMPYNTGVPVALAISVSEGLTGMVNTLSGVEVSLAVGSIVSVSGDGWVVRLQPVRIMTPTSRQPITHRHHIEQPPEHTISHSFTGDTALYISWSGNGCTAVGRSATR